MPGKRKYFQGDVQHIYQISVSRGLVFCTPADYLLLFTLICSRSSKYKVRVLALSIMLNHFHIEAIFEKLHDMESFMNDVTSVFARKYNRHYGLSGKLFHRPYGSSNKGRESYIFDCYLYIGNNAKVKHAVARAEDYRWNFLRYMDNPYPFSFPYNQETATGEMKLMVRKLKKYNLDNRAIDYDFFECKEYESMNDSEKQQLADMVVTMYNVIDYSVALKRFGSPGKIYEAMNTVSGSDYNSHEDTDLEKYPHYYRMINLAVEEGYDMRRKRYVGIGDGPMQMPQQLADRLRRRFNADLQPNKTELKKFFSINEQG